MYKVPLLPSNVEIPRTFGSDRYTVEPLSYDNMYPDYESVDKGADNLGKYLRQGTGFYKDCRLAEEIVEVGWHMGEWERRRSFAYVVMSPDRMTCIGGVYVNPTKKRDYDALALMWLTPDAEHLDAEVYEAFRKWLAEKWPLDKVGFPGREMSFEKWDEVPEQPGPRLTDTGDKR